MPESLLKAIEKRAGKKYQETREAARRIMTWMRASLMRKMWSSACGVMKIVKPGDKNVSHSSSFSGLTTVTTGSGIMCKSMLSSTTRICCRFANTLIQ